jgi:hypothetical protein
VNNSLIDYPIIDQWEQTRPKPTFLKDSHIHATLEVVRKYKHNSYMVYKFISLVTKNIKHLIIYQINVYKNYTYFLIVSILIKMKDNSKSSHRLASTTNIFIEHVTHKLNNSYAIVC